MKAILLLLLGLCLFPAVGQAQTVDKQKLDSFATAVAHAEGFGVRHAIPTRYHNPGDLKSAAIYKKLPGQKALGKGDHVVFESDAAGWAALRDYLSKMVDGRSKRFNPEMTLAQVSRVYAGNWRPWLKIVTAELNASPTTKLRELLFRFEPSPLFDTELEASIPVMLIKPLEIVVPAPRPPVLQAQDDNQFFDEDFQY
jgi:hypothetical protein